jgi:hypothetical protein
LVLHRGIEEDPTCCLVNGSLVPHNWTGTVGETGGLCNNGSLEVNILNYNNPVMIWQFGSRFLQDKLMEKITVTDEDLGLAFETYISICRDDAKNIKSNTEYFMVIIDVVVSTLISFICLKNLTNKRSGECYNNRPTGVEGNSQGKQLIYNFDGQG